MTDALPKSPSSSALDSTAQAALAATLEAPPDLKRETTATAGRISGDALPLTLLERFDSVELLGQGGMGTVYRARDRRLGRDVAIKLLHGGDAEAGRRFLLEAKAQARIEHENICKIYEAGGAEGRRFIVMQLIHGEPLDKAKERMTTEQKVKVVAEAAAALHEAHRTGLVHRDVKPGNIIVERSDDGVWKPYVMDFGLARETDARRQTITGVIAGTPAFMAPEQARGEIKSLDRRTDVYSLGATLYDLLGGQPPFSAPTLWELLQRVGHEDAPPLRQVSREVPEDLETVVMKCLEREPRRRYDSARALADDLRRYLDGEPIMARRASIAYVLRKKVLKHKLAVGLASAALLAAAVIVALWIRAGRMAAERASLSHELGQDVKEMELFLQYAYALPLHDIERERDIIRARLQEIRARIQRAGRAAEGPGHYALGRGHLSLREPEEALVHLRLAAAAGYSAPELDYATGRALGELFRKALEETRRIERPEERQARVRAVEADYRDPALAHLRRALGSPLEAPEYVEGLIAFYEGKHDEALDKARRALARSPWLYEAEKLAGDIHFTEGSRFRADGEFEYERMIKSFKPAAEAYRRAAETARSDPSVHEAECELWIQMMLAEGVRGDAIAGSFERAKSACEIAVWASGKGAASRIKLAQAHVWFGLFKAQQPEDTTAGALEKAVKLSEDAATRSPTDAMAHYTLGAAWWGTTIFLENTGIDGLPAAEHAAAAYRRAIEIDPKFLWATRELGTTYIWKAKLQALGGMDPESSLKSAIEQLDRASALASPSFLGHLADRCLAEVLLAGFVVDQGRSPEPWLSRATRACEAFNERSPSASEGFVYLAEVNLIRGIYEQSSGADPRASFARATQNMEVARKRNPSELWNDYWLGRIHAASALYAIQQGTDPEALLERAREALQRAVDASPHIVDTRTQRARVELTAIRWTMKIGKVRPALFEAAFAPLRPLLNVERVDPRLYQTLAEIHELRSAWLLERRQKPDEDVARGLAMADKALALNPHMALALATKGGLYLVRARAAREPSDRIEAARLAKEAFEVAHKENPLRQREDEPALREVERLLGARRERRHP